MPDEPMVHVIDDDEALRESLAFLFSTAQLPVRTYESAAAFLGGLPASGSGCVITDLRMPEMSGVDLLRRLNSLGVGLPGARRLVDEFELVSNVGVGTSVTLRKWLR